MGGGFVLSVWDRTDAPDDGGAPMRLVPYEVDDAGSAVPGAPIATHDEGVDTSPIIVNGDEIDLSACCTNEGLTDIAQVNAIGEELWRRLTPPAIRQHLGPLACTERIHLDLRSPRLWAYPWEFLRFDMTTVFAHPTARWSIGNCHVAHPDAPANDHPLRILVLVGHKPDTDIADRDEIACIERMANSFKTEVFLKTLVRPSSAQVKATMDHFRPHVFHLITHGSVVNGAPRFQVFDPNLGVNVEWDAQQVRDIFGTRPPRLAVLNACFVGDSGGDPSSLLNAFVDVGTLAVVGMLHEVLAPAAAAFTAEFYELLFDGEPIDAAAAQARLAIRSTAEAAAEGDLTGIRASWPLPRLVVRGTVDDVVRRTCGTDAIAPVFGPQAAAQRMVRDFIARWDERFATWDAIGSETRMALLRGGKESGRSQLLRCIADICERRGDLVIRVFPDEVNGSGEWRDLLTEIVGASRGLLPAERVSELDDVLAAAAADIDSTQQTPLTARLLDKLAAAAGDRRTLLAIDGLDRWDDDLVAQILVDLCAPLLSRSELTNMRMLVATSDSTDSDVIGLPRMASTTIKVTDFDDDEWDRSLPHFIDAQSEQESVREAVRMAIDAAVIMYGKTGRALGFGRLLGAGG